MSPGADPLPAVKEAIAYLCVQWVEDIDLTPLLAGLEKWAIRRRNQPNRPSRCSGQSVLGVDFSRDLDLWV